MTSDPVLLTQDPPAGAVLAAVDGSGLDALVLTAATAEAAVRGAPLHVRHCRDTVNPWALGDGSLVDWGSVDVVDGAEDLLEVALRTVGELDAGVAVTADHPLGRPENRLVEASADAALVVLGTGRKSGVEELVLGTVSLTVAAHAHCPVLVVPPGVDPDGDGDVVVGVDGSDHSRQALAVAAEEARLRGAALVVVTTWHLEVVDGYVVTEPDSPEWRQVEERYAGMQARLLAEVDTEGLQVRTRVVKGAVRTTLAESSAEAAMVVVGNRGRGGFASKALGSVTMDLLKQARCPVLVVHARD